MAKKKKKKNRTASALGSLAKTRGLGSLLGKSDDEWIKEILAQRAGVAPNSQEQAMMAAAEGEAGLQDLDFGGAAEAAQQPLASQGEVMSQVQGADPAAVQRKRQMIEMALRGGR